MDFASLPPEINSGLMYAGPGAGAMLAATGWDALAAELESTASGYAAELAGLTGQAWSGPSSLLMTAAVTGRSAVRAADLDDDYLDGRIGHPRNGFQ